MAARFAQRIPSGSEESFTLGAFNPYEPFARRGPHGAVIPEGAQIGRGQRRQDVASSPREFASPPGTVFSGFPGPRETPSVRPVIPKESDSFLGTESSGPLGGGLNPDEGMTLSDILFGPSAGSIPAQRRLILSDPNRFGLGNLGGEDRLNEFLLSASNRDPRTFLRELLGRMSLRPSNLLGGRI